LNLLGGGWLVTILLEDFFLSSTSLPNSLLILSFRADESILVASDKKHFQSRLFLLGEQYLQTAKILRAPVVSAASYKRIRSLSATERLVSTRTFLKISQRTEWKKG